MTCQEIIDMAIQRSNLNDPDLIPDAQLLDFITSFERFVFLEAARENPDFFGREGNTNARGASTDNWDLTSAPGNVAAFSRLEVQAITGTVSGISVGDEVNVVSIRNPWVELAPRVYVRDRVVHEYNSELQDDSSNFVTTLKVYYSFLPTDKTSTADTLDLPDEFNLLVVLPLARVMALRDQRPDDAQALNEEFLQHYRTFIQQVSVFDEAAMRELEGIPAASRRLTPNG